MVDAFLVRVSPRYEKSGNRRGTLIDPERALVGEWSGDQKSYYNRTFQTFNYPQDNLYLEFGQPPKELVDDPTEHIGDLVFLVIGAESSQGSDNERGIIGVGSIANIELTQEGSGASRRLYLRVDRLVYASKILERSLLPESRYFPGSGLGDQTIFGWSGSPSAQNAYSLHDRRATDPHQREVPVLHTLALMSNMDADFRTRFETTYPQIAAQVQNVPEPADPQISELAPYVPPEIRREPISARDIQEYLEAKGFTFDPWQVAAYVAAVRTKPFVILSGISGTGKTQLPLLVAEATGAFIEVASVRPDWTDSSELLGYTNLAGQFIPGQLIEFARAAMDEPDRQHFFVLDEMNIARTEYYLAEVLSVMERRDSDGNSAPVLSNADNLASAEYADVVIPPNLTLVGSVNVDESTFEFSRKVLDRSFVLEFNSPSLANIVPPAPDIPARQVAYSSASWRGKPAQLGKRDDMDTPEARHALDLLVEINEILKEMQLGVGYRVRDEFVSFVLEAREVDADFRDGYGNVLSPLDVAVESKILPRVAGSASALSVPLARLIQLLTRHDLDHAAARVEEMDQRGARDNYVSFF